jgi:hypothetical protein
VIPTNQAAKDAGATGGKTGDDKATAADNKAVNNKPPAKGKPARSEIIKQMFEKVDVKNTGRLGRYELWLIAIGFGFPEDDPEEEFQDEYEDICRDYKCKQEDGVDYASFEKLLNDKAMTTLSQAVKAGSTSLSLVNKAGMQNEMSVTIAGGTPKQEQNTFESDLALKTPLKFDHAAGTTISAVNDEWYATDERLIKILNEKIPRKK